MTPLVMPAPLSERGGLLHAFASIAYGAKESIWYRENIFDLYGAGGKHGVCGKRASAFAFGTGTIALGWSF